MATSAPRELLQAIGSVARTGGAWRLLPQAVPPWPIGDHDVRRWRANSPWPRLQDLLRGDVRVAAGRHRHPSAGRLARQAVPTSATRGHGYAPPPKVQGRQRPSRVETFGLRLAVVVTAARVPDREGALPLLVLRRPPCSRLRLSWADQASTGELVAWRWALRPRRHIRREMGPQPAGTEGFQRLPTRWMVEHTCGGWPLPPRVEGGCLWNPDERSHDPRRDDLSAGPSPRSYDTCLTRS